MSSAQPSPDGPPAPPVVELAPLIEKQQGRRAWYRVFAVCCLITFLDGFDFQILSFTATYLKDDFGLSDTQLGTLGTVGLFGTLVGGLCMGYLGDRLGRKPSIVVCVAGFGVFMTAFALAETYEHLFVLRFVSGFFLGGVLPLSWALTAEYAPKRVRVTAISVIMVGYTLGGAAGGPVSNLLVPDHGWTSVFVAGGVCSLLALVPVMLLLPESVKFLAQRGGPDADRRIAAVLTRLWPGHGVAPGTHFVAGDPQPHAAEKKFTPLTLFRGSLARITPLLWTVYVCSSALIYFMVFWTPLINERMGFSVSNAALIAAAASVAGACAQLAISRFVDRRGVGSILWMPLTATAAMLMLGLGAPGPVLYVCVVISAKMFINGGHGGITSIAGTFYPTAIRANGAAWASSVAKVGAMVGPWLGGVLLDAGLGTSGAFTAFALCPAVMVVVLFVMGRAQKSLSPDTEGALASAAAEDGTDATGPSAGAPEAAAPPGVLTGGPGEAVPGGPEREPQP
ncbi:MFS transporter [Streptomyces sp. WMMB 322]|uniref:MFS transporter n=1 Tax=Streptomyces sp. WMMB 322 TaxID=1286821 RepID=UPI0006E3D307|nr:MFS transporter [Streptomyces sp. WMMB 322]SCK53773.1 MFS transporter, AAHS family, 4-hydroxybenzoate transporter [Streptomyces sp. WMMB 322]